MLTYIENRTDHLQVNLKQNIFCFEVIVAIGIQVNGTLTNYESLAQTLVNPSDPHEVNLDNSITHQKKS